MKKIIAALLAIQLVGITHIPCLAFSFNKKKNVIKTQLSEYKFENINFDWWKDYNDEYLEGYIAKAVDNNQDLKIATLKVEEARQSVKLQFSQELPNASVGVSPLLYKMTGVRNTEINWAFPLMVSYEPDIFLKNHDKTKSVKKIYEMSQLQEKATYIAMASYVGATYFNLVKFDKLISLQEEIINDRKQIFELMQKRNECGITSTADLTRAEKAYVMAVADLSDLKKARTLTLNSLAVLIGESPNNVSEFNRVSYDELVNTKSVPEEISTEVIMQRPDYQAAEKNVEKAGIDVRVARKEFLPSFDIIGLVAFNTNSLGAAFNWTNAIAGVLGQAMLPIFTGGARFANLRIYKNRYEQVMQNYYKTNLTAIQEVNDALSSLKLDTDKHEKNLKSYKMQKEDFGYMLARYDQGIMSKLDLLQQKETLLVMDKMVVASNTDCFVDQISLYKAVGGKL